MNDKRNLPPVQGDQAPWAFRQWRRFGHDRLYVERPDGTTLGHWDLVSDTYVAESAEVEAELRAAARAWRAQQASAAHEEPDQIGSRESRSPDSLGSNPADPGSLRTPRAVVDAACTDLAHVRAGAAARAQAAAAKEAAPVRTLLARVLGMHTVERAWRIGADGEELVAARLAKLARKDPRWKFLHAVPVGDRGADIDHVVIGPGGSTRSTPSTTPGARSGSVATR